MHILALDAVGIDVCPRRLRITGVENPNLPERILELEKKDCRNSDYVILNTLPSFYERQGSSKFIAYYVCETNNFKASGWTPKINIMDHAITSCYHNKKASQDSGVQIPISVVRHAIDVNKFDREYPIHPIRLQNKDSFIFYTISELTHRKNVSAILRAFHTEFGSNENVSLYIKTSPVGLGNEPHKVIDELINKVKRGLKLHRDLHAYKKEFVICNFSSEEEINSIHTSCDCYLTSSRGEAFNLPLADAMLAGNIVVAPNHSGMDYINENNAFVVKSYPGQCFGATDCLEDLYGGNESWWEIDVNDLRLQMRNAFEKRNLAKKKIEHAKRDIQKFSFESVGSVYKRTLEDAIK